MFNATPPADWADPSQFTYPFTPGERLRLAMYRDAVRAGLYTDDLDSPAPSRTAAALEDCDGHGMG
jgi:hypothetical protein